MPTLPPQNPTPESLMKMIRDLQREVALLKQRPHADDVPLQRRQEVVFSCFGPITEGQTSGSYLTKDFTATIHRLDITAADPGAGPSDFEVLVDGEVVFEDSFPGSTEFYTYEALAIEVEDYARLQINWPSVGSGLGTVTMTFQLVAIEGEEYD